MAKILASNFAMAVKDLKSWLYIKFIFSYTVCQITNIASELSHSSEGKHNLKIKLKVIDLMTNITSK